MNSVISSIDTVYDFLIATTMQSIRACVRVGNEPVTKPQEDEISFVEEMEEVEAPQTFKKIQDILKTDVYVDVSSLTNNTVMYAGNITVPVYQNPTIELDSQSVSIPYGEMIMMLEVKGRFYRIAWGTHEGWVLKEDLADRASRVHPEFFIGQANGVDDTNTVHIRAILGDIFGLARSEFSLQAGEYVLYKLWKKGRHVPWSETRPRVPGLWHKILKGSDGIKIGVVPKVGSIMEYMLDSDIGHLAYVEAVFPDNTITISEANYPDSGIYNERELTEEEWKGAKPIFIAVA